jgi:hypothetical protein
MDTFVIFGLTFGVAGFVMGLTAWMKIGRILVKIEAQRKELDALKKQLKLDE